MATGDTSDPSCFFGSETYFEGHRLEATGYSYEKALVIKHEWAVSRQESKCEPGPLICARMRVTMVSVIVTKFSITTRMRHRFSSPFWKMPRFWRATKAPHQWGSKDEVRLKHFYPRWSRQDGLLRPHRVPDGVKKIAGSDWWPFAKPFLWFATLPLLFPISLGTAWGNFGETCQCCDSEQLSSNEPPIQLQLRDRPRPLNKRDLHFEARRLEGLAASSTGR